MRYLLSILFFVLLLPVSAQVKTGQFLRYTFDNTNIDSTLSGNDLTAYGNATYDAAVKAVGSHSGKLDGNNDYFKTEFTTLEDTVLISFWIRSNASITTTKRIFGPSDSVGTSDDLYIVGYPTDFTKVYTSANAVYPQVDFTTGVWHNFIYLILRKTTNTVVRAYHDGERVNMVSNDSILNLSWDIDGFWNIGVDNYLNADFNGNIDELIIWKDFVPTNAQIDSIYHKYYIGSDNQNIYNPPQFIPSNSYIGRARPTYGLSTKYMKYGGVVVPYTDTIRIMFSNDFEDLTSASINTVDSMTNRFQIINRAAGNYNYQSIVDISGNNVLRSSVSYNQMRAMSFMIALADTASDAYIQYRIYADPLFDHIGVGGISAGKMGMGLYLGNNMGEYGELDTTTIFGSGRDARQVWGINGMLMAYGVWHMGSGLVASGVGCGVCGQWPIPKGYWQDVILHLRVNDIGKSNGFAEYYIKGPSDPAPILKSLNYNLKFRSVSQGEDFGKIEAFVIQFYFGGSNLGYASPRDQFIYIDAPMVWSPKPGNSMYNRPMGTKNVTTAPILTLPTESVYPPPLLYNETYANASDTVYAVGNNVDYISWMPYLGEGKTITKTIDVGNGTIDFKFLEAEFGGEFGPQVGDAQCWVKIYQGIGTSTLLYTFGQDVDGNTPPGTGTRNIPASQATIVIHPGYGNADRRGIAIHYDRIE